MYFYVFCLPTILLTQVYESVSLSTCSMTSGCSLSISSGQNVDFCPIFDAGNIIIHPQSGSTIEYNGQSTVPCPGYSQQSICIKVAENTYLGVGKLIPSDMTCAMERENADTNEYVFTVTYKSDNVKSDVRVEYKGSIFESFVYVPESQYNFVLVTQKPHTNDAVDPGVGGIVAMLLLMVAALSYFVIGMFVMRFYRGARGVEMIPNLSFWKDFPFLVMDGVLFAFLGWPCCKNRTPLTSSTPVTSKFNYDTLGNQE